MEILSVLLNSLIQCPTEAQPDITVASSVGQVNLCGECMQGERPKVPCQLCIYSDSIQVDCYHSSFDLICSGPRMLMFITRHIFTTVNGIGC